MFGCRQKTGLPNLTETYRYNDKKPFGTGIAFKLLSKSYPGDYISIKNDAFAKTAAWISDTSALYVNISAKFFIDESDAAALMNFVFQGNRVLISANEIDTLLLKELHTRQSLNAEWLNTINPMPYATTTTTLIKELASTKNVFSYFYYPVQNHFISNTSVNSRVAGYNGVGKPNFIVYNWGKGKLYLHCEPRIFSNYFLLNGDNYLYLSQVLQMMPAEPEHIYWDDYYNRHNFKDDDGSFSTLGMIFKNPPLKWAFWIALLLLLLYILFNGKRRQRIVPVIKPVQNSSVAFAEAIAGLYLKEKNNKSIAEKMITYFNEYIRTRYFLNTGHVNNEFIEALSRKSGVGFAKTEILYRTIRRVTESEVVDDYQLLNLNEQIQQFYKNKN
jgi:hypothetical protein